MVEVRDHDLPLPTRRHPASFFVDDFQQIVVRVDVEAAAVGALTGHDPPDLGQAVLLENRAPRRLRPACRSRNDGQEHLRGAQYETGLQGARLTALLHIVRQHLERARDSANHHRSVLLQEMHDVDRLPDSEIHALEETEVESRLDEPVVTGAVDAPRAHRDAQQADAQGARPEPGLGEVGVETRKEADEVPAVEPGLERSSGRSRRQDLEVVVRIAIPGEAAVQLAQGTLLEQRKRLEVADRIRAQHAPVRRRRVVPVPPTLRRGRKRRSLDCLRSSSSAGSLRANRCELKCR